MVSFLSPYIATYQALPLSAISISGHSSLKMVVEYFAHTGQNYFLRLENMGGGGGGGGVGWKLPVDSKIPGENLLCYKVESSTKYDPPSRHSIIIYIYIYKSSAVSTAHKSLNNNMGHLL
jgi:hypothetical protein